MTDAGMTGDYESVIGMQKEEPLGRFLRGYPAGRFEAADGVGTLSEIYFFPRMFAKNSKILETNREKHLEKIRLFGVSEISFLSICWMLEKLGNFRCQNQGSKTMSPGSPCRPIDAR